MGVWDESGSGEAIRGRSRPRPCDRRDVDYRPPGSHGCTDSVCTSAPPGSPPPCPTPSPRHSPGFPSGRSRTMLRCNTAVRIVGETRINSIGRADRTVNGGRGCSAMAPRANRPVSCPVVRWRRGFLPSALDGELEHVYHASAGDIGDHLGGLTALDVLSIQDKKATD
jgi:hypothetical protein